MVETVRSIRLVLDAEMQRMTGGLQVLSLTNALRNGDFDDFRRIAAGFLEQYGKDGVVLVADRDGRQLFSSVTSDTASLPPRNNRDIVEKVFATNSPQYSNLFIGAVKKRLIVTVEVPVLRDGEVSQCHFVQPADRNLPGHRRKAAPEPGLDDLDLRSRRHQFRAGAEPAGHHRQARLADAVCRDVPRRGSHPADGVARRRAADHEFCALLADRLDRGRRRVAESSLVGPLWRDLAITSAIGGVLLLIGLAFAVRMATTIARGEMLHDLLIEELNHRVKNTLAILQAIATQTFRSATRAEREKFEGRLGALAEAHNLLSKEKWQGSELKDVIGRVLQPYLLNAPERLRMSGPRVPLSPRLAVVLSMIVHEIATNAAKYGALSNDTGKVALDWEVISENAIPKLRLIWTESGGPHVSAPVQRGFGSRLIERSARDQLGGEATVDFLPRGVVYTVTCRLEGQG